MDDLMQENWRRIVTTDFEAIPWVTSVIFFSEEFKNANKAYLTTANFPHDDYDINDSKL